MTKPDGISQETWDNIMHPAHSHHCYECRFCKPVPEEMKAKGRAHSYCTAKLVVSRTSGIKLAGKWFELVSAKQVISCKLFEPLKEASK